MIKKGEIVYCNITVIKDKNKVFLNNVVYKEVDGFYKQNKVVKIDIIKRLGFESKQRGYNEVKKSNEERNKITGAYD